MLVDKDKISAGDVVSFKISSGEELVAKIASITTTDYILNRPLALGMSPKGPIFTPYMVTVDFKKEDLQNKIYFKNYDNDWVNLGSNAWHNSHPVFEITSGITAKPFCLT